MGDVDEKALSRLPRAVVIAAGLVIGFFIWRTYGVPAPRYYPVAFQQGQWMATPDEEPQAYFRKELNISGPVQQAWMIVAATDAFTLYLNNQVVDSKRYYSMNVSGIYDMGPNLHPGKNVIGIAVRRRNYPGPAMAAVEGAYRDDVGQEYPFASDPSWRASGVEQRQGKILWHADSFDVTLWKTVKMFGRPSRSAIYPLPVDPLAFKMPMQGTWIGYPNLHQNSSPIACTLNLAVEAEDAWIRIAAADRFYTFVVNGVKVVRHALSSIKDPVLSLPEAGQGNSTDLYNITSLLKEGQNRIVVMVDQTTLSGADLFMDGFVVLRGKPSLFGTGIPWTEVFPSASGEDLRLICSQTNVRTHHGLQSQGLPAKNVRITGLAYQKNIKGIALLTLVLFLSAGAACVLWRGTASVMAFIQQDPQKERDHLSLSALAYVPTLFLLGGLLLVSFDVRINPSFPYQGQFIGLALVALLAFQAFLIGAAGKKQEGLVSRLLSFPMDALRMKYVGAVLLVSLLVIGAFLRLRNVDGQSLYHDEVHMVYFVKGLFEKGYPYIQVGPIERFLATYEILPYPIALSAFLFGFTDFAVRLPAALFGIMMIFFIYYVGKQVFDARVGLLASAIYTFCPQTLVWANYLWHPQQLHFFALLTAYLLYQALSAEAMSPKRIYPFAVSFICTYLSWEGVGFLLPALFLGLLVVKGRDVSWMREKHLWIAIGLVGTALIAQLLRRIGLQTPYMMVGAGLSDVSLPTPFFLDPMYDPTFYIKNFLWLDNNVILTLLVVGGLFFCRQHKGFAYFATVLFAILLMMTNLLAHAAVRYVYYLQLFLILTASCVAFHIIDRAAELAIPFQRVTFHRLAKGLITGVLCVGVVMGSSQFMKLYRLTGFYSSTNGIHLRPEIYYIDYRSTSKYIKDHYRPGDMVISVLPYTLQYYSDITTDYFLEAYPARQILYDPSEVSPQYLERTAGRPVISNLRELERIVNRQRRTWVVAVPYTLFSFLSGTEMSTYISEMGQVAYESYNARVYLLQS